MHNNNLIWFLIFNTLFFSGVVIGAIVFVFKFWTNWKFYNKNKVTGGNWAFFINFWICGFYFICVIFIFIFFLIVLFLFIFIVLNKIPDYETKPLGYLFYTSAWVNYILILLLVIVVSFTINNSFILITPVQVVFFSEVVHLSCIKELKKQKHTSFLIYFKNENNSNLEVKNQNYGLTTRKIIFGHKARKFIQRYCFNNNNDSEITV